ncbi:NAD-dependent epimerase/dehydratase family protein [Paenibacillus pasadenensis]|uniref:UDP-glucose 4-epimerase n=1 Tax=Paenibacillus pasadenensis TaxID=217090 RepID=A0A2N5N2R6_9BACL|nr:NAD(P)-dependent oxidoreductase [Paenibacillus pasadenensis]PLT44624.1 UDP-glucose 4-epimerase [Paenibacillus pasadenensis]
MKIAVTGGSGRIGRFVLRELLEHGHEPVNVDLAAPAERICRTAIADLTDLGEVYGALQGADAVLHLAGVNAPGKLSPEKLFRLNSLSTYQVLEAAAGLGISRVAAASSESIYGWCFARHRFAPQHAPVDESHPLLPQESYGLSKIAGEQAMAMFHRRTGMQAVALRFGHVPLPEEYEWLSRHEGAERFLWSHVDSRDAAAACRLAVEADGLGFEAVNVTADDTCSLVPNEQLAARFYPSLLEFARSGPPHAAWSSNAKAKRLLGWQPRRSWR